MQALERRFGEWEVRDDARAETHFLFRTGMRLLIDGSTLAGSLCRCGLAAPDNGREWVGSLGRRPAGGLGGENGQYPRCADGLRAEHAVSFIYQEAVMSGLSVTGGSAGVQSDLWGARAREWCAMEAQMRPLYETVLERVGIGHGYRVA